jgi:hypothetical protein
MPDAWKPIYDNHAIDAMAAVIQFSQPLPDLLLRKCIKAAEDVAFELGLKSRHSTQATFQVLVGAADNLQGLPQFASGAVFNSTIEDTDGQRRPTRIAEQLQVDQNQVAYRTWNYVSWSWQLERMKTLMRPPLRVVQDAVSFSMQRLEVSDRYTFFPLPGPVPKNIAAKSRSLSTKGVRSCVRRLRELRSRH